MQYEGGTRGTPCRHGWLYRAGRQHGLEKVTALARSVSVETAATGKRVVAVVALA
ncbi:hypothetical protein OHN99_03320 [Streptomyces jietaisiensis]|uniref:hypothetical protein n=1 Tax=Streptomyces griseoaurantiacus TaxID=68213 RepID=UPI002E27D59E|nr:hypothetical protein [Streptomyces jietaisiensis]